MVLKESFEILGLAGEYVDCPRGYFGLRNSCHCLFTRMPAKCPIRLSTIYTLFPSFDDSDDEDYYKWLRIATFGSPSQIEKFLSKALTRPSMSGLIDSLLASTPLKTLSGLASGTLDSLIEAELTGDCFFENHEKLVAACNARTNFDRESNMRSSLLDYMKARALTNPEAVTRGLQGLDRTKCDASSVFNAAMRGGSSECVDQVLGWAGGEGFSGVMVCTSSAVKGGNPQLVERVLDGMDEFLCVTFPLMTGEAVRSGKLELVRFMLDHGSGVTLPLGGSGSGWGYFPADLIAGIVTKKEVGADDLAILDLLLDRKADINMHDLKGIAIPPRPPLTLLSLAAESGRFDICDHLLDRGITGCLADMMSLWEKQEFDPGAIDVMTKRCGDVNACADQHVYGYAITAACAFGNVEAGKELLRRGANLNVRGGTDGHTPLTALIPKTGSNWKKWVRTIATVILERCPELASTPTNDGVYPLCLIDAYRTDGTRKMFDKFAELLVAHGADPNKLCEPDMLCRPHRHGTYQLRRADATREGSDAQTRRWIDGGLDLSRVVDGKNAVAICAERGDALEVANLVSIGESCDPTLIRRIIHKAVVRNQFEAFDVLLARTGGINSVLEPDLNTILMEVAVTNPPKKEMEFLLSKEPNINMRNALGQTALHCSLFGKAESRPPIFGADRYDSLNALLDKKADVNIQDNLGRTPLWLAAQIGDDAAIGCFVRNGGDVNIPDANGVFPVDLMMFRERFLKDLIDICEREIVDAGPTGEYRCMDRRWMAPSPGEDRMEEVLIGNPDQPPIRPKCDIAFAKQNGFLTIQRLLENPTKMDEYSTDIHAQQYATYFGFPVIRAAMRQLLDELRSLVAQGAKLDVCAGRMGYTPLTACFEGWDARGVAGVYSKLEVAEFLLEQCPELATKTNLHNEAPLQILRRSIHVTAEEKPALIALIEKYQN